MGGNVSRLGNIFPDVAIKAPCRVATTGNVTLSGLQTIDGIALAEGDRVLVRAQTDTTQNGLWQASSGNWIRTQDASKNTDFIDGTLVFVSHGTLSGASPYVLVCADSPVLIGTSHLVWYPLLLNGGQFLTLKSYGAKGDGVTNDTAALLAHNAAGGYAFVTPGTYVFDATVLTNSKGLIGLGRPTFIPSGNVPTGATQAFFLLFSGSGCNDAVVSGITFSASKVTYPNLYLLSASATSGVHFFDNVTSGGSIGIYGANCVNHYVERNTVSGYASKGISHDGASQNNVNVNDNAVDGAGSNNHCVGFQLGGVLHARNNNLVNGGFFGIGVFQAIRIEIDDNESAGSAHEAYNTEDCSVLILTNNLGYWAIGASHDFGASLFGNAVNNQFSVIEGNQFVNANSAGIALASKVSFAKVRGNLLLNCCQAGTSGAIQLSGANCLKNEIVGNDCLDITGGLQRSGVQEVDLGLGLPSINKIKDNFIENWTVIAVESLNALSLPALTVNTNNYAPTNGRYYEYWVIQATGAVNLTGIADGYPGARKVLWCAGAATITLKDNNAGSLALNRISLGSDFALVPGASIALEYVGGAPGTWIRV